MILIQRGACSTPSGISEGNATGRDSENHCGVACSTPSGISEGNADHVPLKSFRGETSAQRLPASAKETHRNPQGPLRQRSRAQRLPASAKETPDRPRSHAGNHFRAQRLPASAKETPDATTIRRRFRKCSTPSGISEGNATTDCSTLLRPRVLNAFRHQRRKRTMQTPHHAAGERVLNAFRHQRRKRTVCVIFTVIPDTCSTPSGISEGNATEQPAEHPPVAVLNAFRHQRRKRCCYAKVILDIP